MGKSEMEIRYEQYQALDSNTKIIEGKEYYLAVSVDELFNSRQKIRRSLL